MIGPRKEVVPTLQVEQLALGELPREEQLRLRAKLSASPGGRSHLEALAGGHARHAGGPSARGGGRRDRASDAPPAGAGGARRPVRRRWIPLTALGVPLAAGLIAIVVPGLDTTRETGSPGLTAAPGESGSTERSKGSPGRASVGSPRLLIHRQTDAGSEALAPGARVQRGDLLQLSYSAAGMRYGAVMSVDGRGVVTQHLPEAGAHAVALSAGSLVPLPHSYELDDAPDFEHFVFVTAPEPFALAPVEDALRSAPAVPGRVPSLPNPLSVIPFTVRKDGR